jgi:hypothetical protein
MAITKVGEYQDFAYTGGMQSFTVPFNGIYKLEVWGAQGGNVSGYSIINGGQGGYSIGYVKLKKSKVLYIGVGGQSNGYNGGGANGITSYLNSSAYGGGATHIAYVNNLLKNIGYSSFVTNKNGLIVAGGGGGAAETRQESVMSEVGGTGGGTSGGAGSSGTQTGPGTQTSGASFGAGSSGTATSQDTDGGGREYAAAGGGGGGFYGGYGGIAKASTKSAAISSGAGGSGWIGGVPSFTYKGVTYSPSTSNGVRSGNGHARITLMKKAVPTIYLGTKQIDSIYLGSTEINTAYKGGSELA